MQMNNRDMAATLFNIATILRERQDNPYRIRAYERGARALMAYREDARAVLSQGNACLRRRPGVLGDKLQRKLRELATAGHMEFYDELCETLPAPVAALMQVPGIGPKTAAHVHDALGIDTPQQMVTAARTGQLQSVWGFGEKRTGVIAQLSLFDEALPDTAQPRAA